MNSALILVLLALGLAAHGIKGNVEITVVIPLIGAALVDRLAGATFAEKTFRAQPHMLIVIILTAALKGGDAISK